MNINKPIARIVVRDEGKGNPAVFGMMSCLIDQTFFEKGMVYEVRETMGEVTIKKIGRSAVSGEGETYTQSPVPAHWAEDISDLICKGKKVFATWEEAEQYNRMLSSQTGGLDVK